MKLRNFKFSTVVLSIIGSILLFAFGIVLFTSVSALNANIERTLEEATKPLVSMTARLLFNPLYTLDVSETEEVLARSSEAENIIYAGVRDKNGKLITGTPEEWNPDESHSIVLAGQALSIQDTIQEISGNRSTIVSPIAVGSEQIGSVEFVFDLTSLQNELKASQNRIAITIILAFIGVIIAISILRRIILRPLNQLALVAEAIGHGNLAIPINPSGTQEMFLLGTTLEQMKLQLIESLESLEQQVADRTRALEVSTEVSRRLSTILDQDELMHEVVEQVQDAFDYYHAHIYLFDERKENLVMVGGTGDAGHTMLKQRHTIPKMSGLVGQAGDTNLPILVSDVSVAQGWLPNPLLPDTKAEASLPIALGDNVLGVLDVQDDKVGGLTEVDVELLQSIANQVASALQNARAYQRTQEQIEREIQMTSISQQIQNTNDVDGALQIAVRELGRTLGNNTRLRLIAKPNGDEKI